MPNSEKQPTTRNILVSQNKVLVGWGHCEVLSWLNSQQFSRSFGWFFRTFLAFSNFKLCSSTHSVPALDYYDSTKHRVLFCCLVQFFSHNWILFLWPWSWYWKYEGRKKSLKCKKSEKTKQKRTSTLLTFDSSSFLSFLKGINLFCSRIIIL